MKQKTITLLLALAASSALHAQTPGIPVVTIQQNPAVAQPLDTVTFTTTVTGAPIGTTFTYQWKLRGVALPGATLPTYTIPQCLSRDMGTYECEIVATKGTNTHNLSGSIDGDWEYPGTPVLNPTADEIAVIGTDGDDDVEITRLDNQLKITVMAAGKIPSQEYRIDTFTCCGVIPRRVIVDLGDGLDFLECDVAAGASVVASAVLLGGGQPGDTALMKDLSGFPSPQVEGFEVVATGGAITGHLAMPTGTIPAGSVANPDNLTPLARALITFSLEGGTQSPWSARLVTNDSGLFLGVLPPLPQGMTTANVVAWVNGNTLTWSALGGGSLIPFPEPLGPHKIDYGLGVRLYGPCAETILGFPSLLIPFDESASDASGGSICKNLVDLGNPALSSAPQVVSGVVRRGRAFDGFGTDGYQVAGSAGVNPGNGDFSLNFWMQRRHIDDRIYYSDQVILDHTVGGTGWKLGCLSGQLYLSMGAGALTTYTSPAAMVPNDGGWHLVSVTVEPWYRKSVIFFIDGVMAGTPVPTVGNPDLDAFTPLLIGPTFKGRMDELEFFKRPITDAEVYALWMAGPLGRCIIPREPSIVMYYGQATEYSIAAAALTDTVLIANLRSPLGDADGDGAANSLEYAFGTDPMLATSVPQTTFALVQGPAGGGMPRLTLTARRSSLRSTVESVVGEFTSNLSQWSPGELLNSEPQTDGTVIETWGDTGTNAPYASRFGRLKETPVP